MKMKLSYTLLLLSFCLFFVSCSSETKLKEGEKEYQIFYLNDIGVKTTIIFASTPIVP